MDKLEMQMDCLERMYRENLKRKIKGLIKNLERELEQLEKSDKYKPNSCGIIQGEASDIDELCVRIGVINSIRCE